MNPLPLLVAALAAEHQAVATNPIFDAADPHAEFFQNELWIYPTHSPRGEPGFMAYSSPDAVTWKDHGVILKMADIKWIKDDGAERHHPWAPAIAEREGKYYLYFSIGPQNPTPSRIGVAVADRPEGPFVDSGKPLLTGGNGFEAIDPMVFRDPKSSRWYLYAGGSAGAKLRVFELKANMTEFEREVQVETPPNFTEGAFMNYRKGTYYLSYSHGGWRDSSYSAHYATSSSPVGPWKYGGAILTSDETHKGPGHHSIVCVPDSDRWFIVYHRWQGVTGNGPYNGARKVAIDRLEFNEAGDILPVKMTDIVPKLRPEPSLTFIDPRNLEVEAYPREHLPCPPPESTPLGFSSAS